MLKFKLGSALPLIFIGAGAFQISCSTHKKTQDQLSPDVQTVLDEDTRTNVTASTYPFTAVGRLSLGNQTMCTAWLVGKDLVATAAHCVLNKDSEERIASITYQSRYKTASQKEAPATILSLGTTTPLKEFNKDWALLRISEKFGETDGFFGVRAIGDGDFVKESANPGYTPPAFQLSCFNSDIDSGQRLTNTVARFFGFFPDGTIRHNGDMRPGCSGAPLWAFQEDGKAIAVAMNVYETLKDGQVLPNGTTFAPQFANGAVPATTFLEALNQALATPANP